MGSGCSPAGFRQFFPRNSQHFCVAPAWASENLHAPCAVFHCDSPIVALHLVQCQGSIVQPPGLHFRGSLPPLRGFHFKSSIVTVPVCISEVPCRHCGFPLQIFHCDSPIVALHLVQCQGSIVQPPGLHFRGSLPLRGFHFKSSIVTVPFFHCTLCSVKVP